MISKRLILIAVWTLLPAVSLSSSITLISKDVTHDCKVEPQPELGGTFTITTTFSFDDSTYYSENGISGAEAKLSVFPRQVFISGDTLISGRFMTGEIYTMSATFRATTSGTMSAGLLIKTFGEVNSEGKQKISSGTITSLECGNYYIPGQPVSKSIILDSTTGLTITTLADSLPQGVPRPAVPFPVDLNATHKTDKRQADEKLRIDEKRIESEKAPKHPAPFVIHLRKPKGGSYEQTGAVKLPKKRQCELIFRDTNSDIILRPQFPDSIRQSWWMHPAGDTGVFLTPQDTGEIYLEGQLDGKVLILRIEVSDAWLLDGIWRYTDPFGNLDNRLSLTTLFFYLKDYQGEWQYWISDYTDANGYFALGTPPLGVGSPNEILLSAFPPQFATATRTVGHQVMSSGHASIRRGGSSLGPDGTV